MMILCSNIPDALLKCLVGSKFWVPLPAKKALIEVQCEVHESAVADTFW